jgi:hypothetical protein
MTREAILGSFVLIGQVGQDFLAGLLCDPDGQSVPAGVSAFWRLRAHLKTSPA